MKRSRINRSREPKVAVLVDTSTSWGRGIIRGIHRYSRLKGAWHLYFEARGANEQIDLPEGWRGDGIIARVGSLKFARQLKALKIPVVNVSSIELPGARMFPTVASDVGAVGTMAASYFFERGFRHFACLSLLGLEYVARQQTAFVEAVEKQGCACSVYHVKSGRAAQAPDWALSSRELALWLSSLPKPVALLTWLGAREVIHACQQAGLLVPDEVAILAGIDDELICEVSHLPVSAVHTSYEQIGMEAASLLERLMEGRKCPDKLRLIPPSGITTRQSTNILAVADPKLKASIRFMQENLHRAISMNEVAAQAGLSRRVFERRFLDALGRPPGGYLRRLRLEKVKNLLTDTSLPVSEISGAAGFGSPEYMIYAFHAEFEITPLQFRRRSTL